MASHTQGEGTETGSVMAPPGAGRASAPTPSCLHTTCGGRLSQADTQLGQLGAQPSPADEGNSENICLDILLLSRAMMEFTDHSAFGRIDRIAGFADENS